MQLAMRTWMLVVRVAVHFRQPCQCSGRLGPGARVSGRRLVDAHLARMNAEQSKTLVKELRPD